MNKPIKIRLHVLSPIHIGCDDVYEPTSFVIDEKKNKLIGFDPMEFVAKLNDEKKKKLAEIANKGTLSSIIELYKFIFNNKDIIKGHTIDTSEDIKKRYVEVKGMPLNEQKIKQELNNFLLPRTAYIPHNNKPYIPGSSLKGAIKTGYLSMLAYSGNTVDGIKTIIENQTPLNSITGRQSAKDLEKELLKGDFATDPFRMLKVADLMPVNNIEKKLIYAINLKKSDGVIRMPVPIEVISSGLFEGSINIETPLKQAGIAHPIIWIVLSSLFHKHYARVYNSEIRLSKKRNFSLPSIERFKDKLKTSAFLIRIGRHSGAEAVTIEGNRNIKVSKPGVKPLQFSSEGATSIWLASDKKSPSTATGLLPFGWAVIEAIDGL
jgi:CRISPR-associated protein Csm5